MGCEQSTQNQQQKPPKSSLGQKKQINSLVDDYHKQNSQPDTQKQQKPPEEEDHNAQPQKQLDLNIAKKVGLDDFTTLGLAGKGAFGKVYKVKKKDNQKIYAMKQISKKIIIDEKLESNTILEKKVLQHGSQHPFIVQLKYSFQTDSKLYFVMEFVSGGEFYRILQEAGKFPENVVRFVAAEVLLALEYLNTELKIIYRDLKPENILLADDGHVKLTDFGLATFNKENEKTFTMAGTPEYLAPEILKKIGYTFEVDLWTLGIFIFEMLQGQPPFTDPERQFYKIQEAILKNQPPPLPQETSKQAKDLVNRLLQTQPKDRIGSRGYQEIKDHPFFETINWEMLYQKKITSPLKKYAEMQACKAMKKKGKEKAISETPLDEKAQQFEGITFSQDMLDERQ